MATVTIKGGTAEELLSELREIELQEFIADCKRDAERAKRALADYEKNGGVPVEDFHKSDAN